MLAIIYGELVAASDEPPGPVTAPIVAYVLWHDGQPRCWPSDGDDPGIAAWQDAARRLVTPEHPLETLTAWRRAALPVVAA